MPRPAIDPDARREQISRAAIEIFARDGYQGAVVDDIAAAAGLSKGSVYRYFADKEDLFHAAFGAFQAELMGECRAAMEVENDAWSRLEAGMLAAVAGLGRRIAVFPVTLEFWAAASAGNSRERFGRVMQGIYRDFRGLVADLVRQGQARGELAGDMDPEAVAAWVVGGVDGLMLQHWFEPGLDPEPPVRNLLATLRRGLAARPGAG